MHMKYFFYKKRGKIVDIFFLNDDFVRKTSVSCYAFISCMENGIGRCKIKFCFIIRMFFFKNGILKLNCFE